jgi:integrase
MQGLASRVLSKRDFESAKGPARLNDGEGLVVVVSKTHKKRFVYRFSIAGKTTELCLGSYPRISFEEARRLAAEARQLHKSGLNPVEERRRREAEEAAAEAKTAATAPEAPRKPTFGAVATQLIAAKKEGWRNEKHRAQWASTLQTYAKPIWNAPVDEVDTDAVVKVLTPIWTKIPETASRVRGRIERVFAAAQARGFVDRDRSNPAAWRLKLEFLLPAPKKLSRGHHKALKYTDMKEFMAQLRLREGPSARALEFLIFNAARSGEVLGAKWNEIDFETCVWLCPKERMKGGKAHQFPLTTRAVEILEQMKAERVSDYVFPGQRKGRPLSNMSMEMLMRRMDVDAVPHGFRSTWRDWAGDNGYPRDLAEQQLAHVISNKTEAAYRRGTALELRREMMVAWQDYIEPTNG